jgi:hypothetical protein
MRGCRLAYYIFLLPMLAVVAVPLRLDAQASPSSSSSVKSTEKAHQTNSTGIDSGSVTNGLYRNKTLGFTCKIPEGWVLRTEEMNAREEENVGANEDADSAKSAPHAASSAGAKVLLAAFSRPPAAKGEDVNSSILIVAESAAAYPGLKDAAQYFEPLTEVARAQGFEVDEEPYEVVIGTKGLVRGDFHKDVGSRVMRQSTLAMLAHGYAVSITVIGGTEDEVEQLIDGLSFGAASGTRK